MPDEDRHGVEGTRGQASQLLLRKRQLDREPAKPGQKDAQ
jgi:hypothetical protein